MDWTALNRELSGILHRSDEKLERMAELAPFDGCSRRKMEMAARSLEFTPAAHGTLLVTEGMPADKVLIVSRGKVRVLQREKEIGVLRKGETFGEMAALSRRPYPGTLVAQGAVELAVMSSHDYRMLLDAAPCLANRVLERVIGSNQPVA